MELRLYVLATLFVLAGCASGRTPSAPTVQPAPTILSAPTESSATMRPDTTATPPAASLPETSPAPAAGDLPSLETPLADPVVEAIVQKAKEMLANKLGIEVGVITLFDLRAMDWPDESLGCPMGSQNYAQVITPGYLIELDTGSSIYILHSDQATRVVLCGIEPTREIYQPP